MNKIGKKFVFVNAPKSSPFASAKIDAILNQLWNGEEIRHLCIDPENFYWEQSEIDGPYRYNYQKKGNAVQWAFRTLLWHLSATGTVHSEKNNGFVEHFEEVRDDDIPLIFIHTSFMTGREKQHFVFLLESIGYVEYKEKFEE